MTGIIKTIVMGKPFGFISAEGQEKDVFFHKDAVVGVQFEELAQGDKVSFDMKTGDDGRTSAANVQRA